MGGWFLRGRMCAGSVLSCVWLKGVVLVGFDVVVGRVEGFGLGVR